MTDDRLARLLSLKEAATTLATGSTPWAQSARSQLVDSTGLSSEGIAFALNHCLEYGVTRATLSGLVRKTNRVPHAHVLLSANVFVAPFRAIALALCQSTHVLVRPSRREPEMARLLHAGSRGAFELTDELQPQPRDHLWAYGSDETIDALKQTLLPEVHLHAHASGMGVAVLRQQEDKNGRGLMQAVDGLARDVIAFDQRGCLSPRIVLVEGSRDFAETVCDLLVEALNKWELTVPRGMLNEQEQADALRHEATITYLGSSAKAGQGMVFLDPVKERIMVPPTGRYLHVAVCDDVIPLLSGFGERITTIGLFNPGHLPGLLRELIGERRFVELGQMQSPPLDGPVDLRAGWRSIKM